MALDFSGNASYPLGLRNNNPGNLRPSLVPWMGQVLPSQNNFCRFQSCDYGLRAMAVDLSNKITKDGLNTIDTIITKYAPPSENDTASYINSVCSYTGWGASDVIEFNDDNLANLMRAQINVEQGVNYSKLISDDDIANGISMMPQSIFNRVQNFFVDNPAIATAAGLGGVAVIVAIVLIILGKSPVSYFKQLTK